MKNGILIGALSAAMLFAGAVVAGAQEAPNGMTSPGPRPGGSTQMSKTAPNHYTSSEYRRGYHRHHHSRHHARRHHHHAM